MSRGTREVSPVDCGDGRQRVFRLRLGHLGDYEATVFTIQPQTGALARCLCAVSRIPSWRKAMSTVKALCALADRYRMDLPIGRAVYAVLCDGAQPKEQMNQLFTRASNGSSISKG